MGVLIGISGVAGSGKDTVGNFFVKNFNFAVVSFADPLKRICGEIFDWDQETLWGPSENRNKQDERYPRPNADSGPEYLSPRHALQLLGSEWGRNCYPNIWVEYALRVSKELINNPTCYIYSQYEGLRAWEENDWEDNPNRGIFFNGVVLPDCRFENEIALVKQAGGILIRVKRPGAGLQGQAAYHASESEQLSIPDSEFDYVIQNNGTLEELEKKVLKIKNELE